MYTKRKRFSLIEAFIGIGVIALGASFTLAGCGMMYNKPEAEQNAKLFVSELELDVDKVFCNGSDSDGDGYVSCTFKMKDGTTRQYECVGWSMFNEGCREPKMSVRAPLDAK